MVGHNVFNDFWRSGRGPHHLPFPQKNNGHHSVFNDFKGWEGATISSHPPRKLWKPLCFQWFFGLDKGARDLHLSKKRWKPRFFNAFGDWAGAPIPPPQNLWNRNVFNDFEVGKSPPYFIPPPQKTMEIIMFSMILAVGQGPPPPPNPFKKK